MSTRNKKCRSGKQNVKTSKKSRKQNVGTDQQVKNTMVDGFLPAIDPVDARIFLDEISHLQENQSNNSLIIDDTFQQVNDLVSNEEIDDFEMIKYHNQSNNEENDDGKSVDSETAAKKESLMITAMKYISNDDVKALISHHEKGLIENFYRIDKIYGLTLLHLASMWGSIECIHWLLLQPDVHPNFRCTPLKITPVHLAAIKGQDESVRALLNGSKYQPTLDARKRTPLHLAAAHGHSYCLENLLKKGLSSAINQQDISRWTPMHHASFNGRSEIISTLIRYGGSTDGVDNEGNTCVHLAAMEGHVQALRTLIYASPAMILKERNNEGYTPSMLAERFYKSDVYAYLLQAETGCYMQDRYEDNVFPGHLAAMKGDLQTLKELLESGSIGIDDKDIYGYTLLHRAASGGHRAIIDYLINEGANIKLKNNASETAADIAKRFQHFEIFQLLDDKLQKTDFTERKSPIEPTDEVNFERQRTESAKLRAKERVDNYLQLLKASVENFQQLGGRLELTDTHAKFITHLKERERQVEELGQQLYHERLIREEIEGKMDMINRVARATEKERQRIQLDYDDIMEENEELRDYISAVKKGLPIGRCPKRRIRKSRHDELKEGK